MCDFDPQANATSGVGVDKTTANPSIYEVLIEGAEDVIIIGVHRFQSLLKQMLPVGNADHFNAGAGSRGKEKESRVSGKDVALWPSGSPL